MLPTDRSFDEDYYLAENPDVALAVRAGHYESGLHHFIAVGHRESRRSFRTDAPNPRGRLDHRLATHEYLRGNGLEIGALDCPCPVPPSCTVTYCDRMGPEAARRLFPELGDLAYPGIHTTVDINTEGLGPFGNETQDFVIFNHVAEHIADPIRQVRELFRVTRLGGHVVIAIPDKRFTWDRPRVLTSWEHLLKEHEAGVTTVTDAHYVDFLSAIRPECLSLGVEVVEREIAECRERFEHAHVWDSASFRDFLARCFAHCRIAAKRVFEVDGAATRHEYFAIFEKLDGRA